MTAPKTAPRKRASSTVAATGARTANGAGQTNASAADATEKKPTVAKSSPAAASKLKPKLVRDSFTIPKPEYAVLDALKLRAANLMRPTKKSEVLRAGIFALNAMNDRAFLAALNSVPSLKTGRPKNVPANLPAPGSTSE